MIVVVSLLQTAPTDAQPTPTFEATFETAADFYDNFDYGYSGVNPWRVPEDVVLRNFHGDHNESCEAPTTSRNVAFGGDEQNLDYSQLFWHCAPGDDPTKGHLMTGVDTLGYNVAWFSPKATFTGVNQVCWDINLTEMSSRKWTQVLFVGPDDAFRYPLGETTGAGPAAARGTGGFDLGYTAPDFRVDPGPHSGIFPEGGTLAGFKSLLGGAHWFQDQDTFTTGDSGASSQILGVTDKATRYEHCLSNQADNTIRLTQATPTGDRTTDMTGQIPSGPVRVVFQDDNYDSPKADNYDPNAVTWHWDDIKIQAAGAEVVEPPPGASEVTPDTTPGVEGDSGGVGSPADSDEVSLASVATKAGDVTRNDAFGILLLVFVALVVGGLVTLGFLRSRRIAGTTLDGGSDDEPAPPDQL